MSKVLKHIKPGLNQKTRFEKIHTVIFENSKSASKLIAREIANLILSKQKKNEECVLGLATGSSPISIYNELVTIHQNEKLSFKNVVTFNLDEYYPISKKNKKSYHSFMNHYLFSHVDIKKENIHIPDGELKKNEVFNFCKKYDKKIDELGGIDFQLLGIGRTGHIGFNEPGSSVNSVTRLVELDYITKQDALGSFSGFENVPNRAITMGINTILNAKRIVLIAWGENKKDVVIKAVESNISSKLPSSFLQNHPNTTFVLDNGSSLELTRIKNPWLVGSVDWNIELKTRAISWLCNKVDKPILRLSNKDYNENNLSELLENHSVSGNIAVSNDNVLKFIEVYEDIFDIKDSKINNFKKILKNNKEIIADKFIRNIAGKIREKEAISATRFLGLSDSNTHFLKLPFYESGSVMKNEVTENDQRLMNEIIIKVKPHQIYSAGDLADPHGTHAVCIKLLFKSLEQLKNKSFMKNCWVWLYRGAWHEWAINELDMAVPMSPEQVLRKRKAIFFHQSQNNSVMFQGDDKREFWERVEERNRDIAKQYRKLGLADYQAMETFRRYHFL